MAKVKDVKAVHATATRRRWNDKGHAAVAWPTWVTFANFQAKNETPIQLFYNFICCAPFVTIVLSVLCFVVFFPMHWGGEFPSKYIVDPIELFEENVTSTQEIMHILMSSEYLQMRWYFVNNLRLDPTPHFHPPARIQTGKGSHIPIFTEACK